MSVSLNELRNRNQKRRTLKKTYAEVKTRLVPDWDDAAQSEQQKSLNSIKSDIRMANAGVENEITFLDKGIVAIAQLVLLGDGIKQPEPLDIPDGTSDEDAERIKIERQKSIGEYWKQVNDTIDGVLAEVYMSMTDKPFGERELPDGSKQKELSGEEVEQVAEKKAKGKRAGKVKTTKIKDDGSEAEAASEVETKELDVFAGGDDPDFDGVKAAELGKPEDQESPKPESSQTEDVTTVVESSVDETSSSETTSTAKGASKKPLSLVPKQKKAVK